MRRIRIVLAATLVMGVLSGSVLATDSPGSASANVRLQRAYVWVAHPNLAQYLRFEFSKPTISCSSSKPRPTVKIVLKHKTTKYDLTAKWCRDSLGDIGWRHHGRWWFDASIPGTRTIDLMANKNPTGVYDFGYWVTIDGKLARSGQVRATVKRYSDRVIWEDEDDFVNICINELKTLWKSGGRLYCRVSGSWDYTLKMLR